MFQARYADQRASAELLAASCCLPFYTHLLGPLAGKRKLIEFTASLYRNIPGLNRTVKSSCPAGHYPMGHELPSGLVRIGSVMMTMPVDRSRKLVPSYSSCSWPMAITAKSLPRMYRRAISSMCYRLGTWVLIRRTDLIGAAMALRCVAVSRIHVLAGKIHCDADGPGFCVDERPSMGISVAVCPRCSHMLVPLLVSAMKTVIWW